MKPPSFKEFEQLATQGNVIPIAESMLADMLTPVSAFLKLCGENENGFLLESVEGGEKVARYSPVSVLVVKKYEGPVKSLLKRVMG